MVDRPLLGNRERHQRGIDVAQRVDQGPQRGLVVAVRGVSACSAATQRLQNSVAASCTPGMTTPGALRRLDLGQAEQFAGLLATSGPLTASGRRRGTVRTACLAAPSRR